MGIAKESWKLIEIMIQRYPERKKEYDDYVESIMCASKGGSTSYDESAKGQSITESKALKMTSVYHNRIKHEIEAVEFAYNSLNEEEKKVMRERFWRLKKQKVPYLKMENINYSERQCKRIVYKVIAIVGKYIGELK